MCGRPLAFRRTPLLRFLTWGRLSLAQVQDNGKSVPGKAEPFRTSDGRAASLAFAMRRFELGDIRGLKIPPDIFARGPLPTRGLLTRFASVLESRHSTRIMSLSSVAV